MNRNTILDYYAQEVEANRLELEHFKLEGIRTREIIERYVKGDGLRILDVGGGAGYYSFWLQQKGHSVTLVDLSPKNIELVKARCATGDTVLTGVERGDAVNLNFPDEQFDIVLMLGPLYHLTERAERVQALSEAMRVLKPNGILLAAVISRYASLIDGFQRDLILDNRFFDVVVDDLNTGLHLNNSNNPEYFTTAYFHTPEEIVSEVKETGLRFETLIAVESFGWMVKGFSEKEKDAVYMKKLLGIIRMVEVKEDLIAISPHIMAVARKDQHR
ncbi:MAG TPA: class I SAM-dependent methyltransferase [Flavisolibacter sp.]|nr:class I SAM-dependent methyltransferase [Flavisolibacter sp.]